MQEETLPQKNSQKNRNPVVQRDDRFSSIRLIGLRQNNLKNIDLEIPLQKLTVVTGLSGSGKSSLAFDTLFAEGQRRYIESLSTYTRQFLQKLPKPLIEKIENIPPAIALEQRNSVVHSRSLVATHTEIMDYFRVLYARIGDTFCRSCGSIVKETSVDDMVFWAENYLPGKKVMLLSRFHLALETGERETASPLNEKSPSPSLQSKKRKKAVTRKLKGKASKKKTKSGDKENPEQTLNSRNVFARRLEEVRNRGFRRLWWQPNPSAKSKGAAALDLEEIHEWKDEVFDSLAVGKSELFIMVDRFAYASHLSPEEKLQMRSRLQDSIRMTVQEGQRAGRGKAGEIVFASTEALIKAFDSGFSCTQCGLSHQKPEPNLFSFNSPMGACGKCSGFGYTLDIDEGLVVPDPSKTMKAGALDPFSKPSFSEWQEDLFVFLGNHGISLNSRYRDLTPEQRRWIWEGDPEDDSFPGVYQCFEQLKKWKYKVHVRVFIHRYQRQKLCGLCHGKRLNADALGVKIFGKTLPEVLDLPIDQSLQWIQQLPLNENQKLISQDAFLQIVRRLEFMREVGVEYLTLSRQTKTLSGGEYQRISLATQLGNGLCGTLYVLDEPSIGLHPADTERLIRIVKRLRDLGNTVVVVEHDLEFMAAADWIIELGPGSGSKGGEVVAQGALEKIKETPGSLTGKYLKGDFTIERQRPPRKIGTKQILLQGCTENNLKNIEVAIPLDAWVVVTGISGSGKSTLTHKTLYRTLARLLYGDKEEPGKLEKLYGAEHLGGVMLLDQSPIGRSSRSNPATYMKAWDEVRKIYANQTISMRRGYTPGHFSFNTDGGRCPTCKGDGEIYLDMHFMAEIAVPCEECDGKRFKKSILEVSYRGKNIHELLNTTIDDAFELMRDHVNLAKKLHLLKDVGLGYLHLGQPAPTLSGGEAQRLKIAQSLDERPGNRMLYLFDEPTTGLHMEDIKKLIRVIHDLVDTRHSVVMVEHHIDIMKQADWIIDLGPQGGTKGGEIIAQGRWEDIAACENSETGRILRQSMNPV